MKKIREKQNPKVIFKSPYYTISLIPLNYRIDISPILKAKKPNHGIDRDCYSELDDGVQKAHIVALQTIEDYFIVPLGASLTIRERDIAVKPILELVKS